VSLFGELKRRNVFRMAGLYVVGAWLVVQVAETVLPAFDVPGWVLRAIIVLLAIGFVPALVFSWLFELTPEGVKRDHEVVPEKSIAPVTGRRMERWMLVGILAIITLFMAEWFWPVAPPESSAVSAASEASIAVLPFVNMSPDADNEFFADGIAEELLNVLVGVEGLQVASRTSAFLFKDSAQPIPEIARMLGVEHVLEGSVRKQGQRVRITAQLIRADSDTHLWSETYERDLTDIFRVQEEIARAITRALESTLGVRRVTVSPPTADLVAYELFLRGRSRFYRRVELDDAIDDLELAVERDPAFAEAWAFLGAANHVASAGWPTERDREALRVRAPLAADRALTLEPDLGIALAVKGDALFRLGEPEQMIEGLRLLEQAADQASADTSARLWLGLSWLDLGFVDRAFPHLRTAQNLDPMVPINLGYLGIAQAMRGELDEARSLVLRAVQHSRRAFWACVFAVELVNRGDVPEAIELLATVERMIDPADVEIVAGMRRALEQPEQRTDWLDALAPAVLEGEALPMLAALMFQSPELVFSGRGERASYQFMTSASWLPSLRWVREDPRFFALMQDRGIVGFWQLQGFPRGCRPEGQLDPDRLDCTGAAP
jgi:TolB-like protein/Flp pilus assembly protein TadD